MSTVEGADKCVAMVVLGIGLLNADAARAVWRAARAERLDASAADA